MNQSISQEETMRSIISVIVKNKNVFDKPNADILVCQLRRKKRRMEFYSIDSVIGKDTIGYKNNILSSRCVYHIFGQVKDDSKWVSDEDWLLTFLLSHNHKEYGATGLTDFQKVN